MKYTILGFDQENLIKLELGLDHAAILRWFIDFRGTNSMKSIIVDGGEYFWISYNKIIEDLPILGFGKDRLYRKLKDLVNATVLKHYTHTAGGIYSYYTIDINYKILISRSGNEGSVKITEGVGENNEGGSVKITDQIDHSIIHHSSIKDISLSIKMREKIFDMIKNRSKKPLILDKKTSESIDSIIETGYNYDQIEDAYCNFLKDKIVIARHMETNLSYFVKNIVQFLAIEKPKAKELPIAIKKSKEEIPKDHPLIREALKYKNKAS